MFTDHSGTYINPNFYIYNEAHDIDGNPATAPGGTFNPDYMVGGWADINHGSSGPLSVKKGYAFWTDENHQVTFIGKSNTGDMSISGLALTENDYVPGPLPNYYDGWNFVGNPYPSAIDWDKVRSGGNLNNVDDGIYVWDGSQYASYAGGVKAGSYHQSNFIAPMQGFYVHARANGVGFTLNNSHRAHSTENYLKSEEKDVEIPNFARLKLDANGYSDYAVIYFKSNATGGFDGRFDGFKMYSNVSGVPHVFTKTTNDFTPLSINVLPENMLNTNSIVPISVKINVAGTYQLSLDHFNFENTHVYFVDKLNEQEIYLNENGLSEYSFTCTAGELSNRFELRFFANNAPQIQIQVQNIDVLEDAEFNISLPADLFVENDANDQITSYSANQQDSESLPEWLHFDAEHLTLSGIAENAHVGMYSIQINAFDEMGAKGTQSFYVTVINTNDAPILLNSLNDIILKEGETMAYLIPSNTFNDIDLGDMLTISLNQSNGEALPNWISYNQETRYLSLQPDFNSAGEYVLTCTASDLSNATASTGFKVSVSELSGVSTLEKVSVSVYPNPFIDVLNIDIQNEFLGFNYQISDITGRVVNCGKINSNTMTLKTNALGAGIYTLQIGKEYSILLIKQ